MTDAKELVIRKFGEARGYVSNAARALGMRQGNLSNYLRGLAPLPQKYIDALNAMPDYVAKSGIHQSVEDDVLVTRFYAVMTAAAQDNIELCARILSKENAPADFEADEAATSRFFELMASSFAQVLKYEYPDAFYRVTKMIAAEKREAAEALEAFAKSRKHIIEDEDPLA